MPAIKSLRTIKLILPMMALVVAAMAIGISAFKNITKSLDNDTFFYHGPVPASPEDLDTPTNYTTEPDPNVTCGGNGELCSIFAPSAGGQNPRPVIDEGNPVSEDPEAYDATYRIPN